MTESLETIERACVESQRRADALRQERAHKRELWWVFWGVLVIGCLLALVLIVLGVLEF